MTLQQFISALKSKNILVTIQDTGESEICRIYADGANALDDALEARTVTRWSITSSTGITVTVSG